MSFIKKFNDFLNESKKSNKIIHADGYNYLVNFNEKVKAGDYAYLPASSNSSINGIYYPLIIKITTDKTYPTANLNGDMDSYNNVFNVEVVNKSEVGPNYHDNEVHLPKSYHLSHFKGKIIASNNPNLGLPPL